MLSQEGWTPLHVAIQSRNRDIAKLLLVNGADKNITNKVSIYEHINSIPFFYCLREIKAKYENEEFSGTRLEICKHLRIKALNNLIEEGLLSWQLFSVFFYQ